MDEAAVTPQLSEHTVAVVVPVYNGEHTLEQLIQELARFISSHVTDGGHQYRISEVVLVHDCGPDASDRAIRGLAQEHAFIHPVWLSRNFGQHAATLAGMASTSADWVVTMDEDGQHDPESISAMLDTAMSTKAVLVYARPINSAPHGLFRNATSAVAHGLARSLSGRELAHFHSFRLVLGEIARGLAAYCGESVYLDVALTWVANRSATCPVVLRQERDQRSAYSPRRLASHFWRLVLTSGTRPLRLVALFGAALGLSALILMGWVLWARASSEVGVPGWTSVMVVMLVTSGGMLLSLGIVAEYLGIAVKTAMGKPLYLVVTDLSAGPLGRQPREGTERAQGMDVVAPDAAEAGATAPPHP